MGPDAGAGPLLTVASTRRELGGMARGGAGATARVVGMGRVAGTQVAALLDAAPCGLLLSLGYAGALDPRLEPGDLVIGSAFLQGARAPIASTLPTTRAAVLLRQAGLTVLEGAILTVEEPLLTPQAKHRAHRASGALVADMEGRWIADAAAARGVPLIGIRAVLDEARFPLPTFLAAVVADGGRREWAHAMRAMARPSAVTKLLPLALKSRWASRSLRLAARCILREGGLLP
ncbi:MAG: hypothetical protein OXT51_08105 [Chloroflexota bacterium]|nr:hypothetical protein [Chloroflexota bacterium]